MITPPPYWDVTRTWRKPCGVPVIVPCTEGAGFKITGVANVLTGAAAMAAAPAAVKRNL
ncbi:hypothetical protein [Pseudomonas typographi]|uniref:Uncharacterized protein n=1 Tax=Pseudomonas typographi TaxID=2715964 RepID=A0ABR7Z139_9PSED|nr:hypothetical protein [Pseudomonas typographi]MBD1553437.1 hypothetical protein [Pseudomonas typographi]MBD1599031.1 hypothetical protein [Pseudomonas typographi]